jgi:uncharacterized protein YqhQ
MKPAEESMAITNTYTKEQITRYQQEFARTTKRAHARYRAGALLIFVFMIGLLVYSLYRFQSWSG